ncbi:hypothetical protein GOFOIKOB_0370 [Methylobacterium tardum]|jgi:hypothetical protein|uniref:Uncharacterized protein n=1 Tax=Methylobacterium tardum TaxID=374432 RepID=A0AA37WUN3_9HYPH|nr:hypothetical protein [Methylobacterium tardum]URD36908.1 hypothetical protein M6G65_32215 [Methylobacterium tardum]GJE47349.1 hypothetical protein GOFOIKOB_0370 [Methylobacterium tardum]GLS71278.1 hypothetical protein GCM10007890_32910 [Methylobacterium tardum]
MLTRTLSLAALFSLALSGAALAQTPAGGGRTEGDMNNPGSVKSNSEKAAERTGSMGVGAAPGTSGGPRVSTPGAPAGSSMGNGVTGSGAAPSGK